MRSSRVLLKLNFWVGKWSNVLWVKKYTEYENKKEKSLFAWYEGDHRNILRAFSVRFVKFSF